MFLICDAKRQVKISWLHAALRLMQESDIDEDEVECIVANLIHSKYIKGYISHATRTLVSPPPPTHTHMLSGNTNRTHTIVTDAQAVSVFPVARCGSFAWARY